MCIVLEPSVTGELAKGEVIVWLWLLKANEFRRDVVPVKSLA